MAHALVRAVFALLRTRSCEREWRSHQCERGTHECVRYVSVSPTIDTGFSRARLNNPPPTRHPNKSA